MATSLSARKAIRVSDRKRVFNDRRRKAMRKVMKQITDLVRADKIKEAKELLPTAYKAIDKAAKRGVIKENTASRNKAKMSRITKASK
jgi:small subunit ribosomal protein S20